MSIYLGDKKLAGNSVKLSHNIGDVFFTKRTDTVLAGAVECNGATYQTTDYTGDGSIGELLEAGKLDYVSLTAYATAISTKGWCDKIGWNGTGTTSFRVPTLTPHIIQKNNIPVKGTGMSLGLTNGTTNAGTVWVSGAALDTKQSQYGQPVSTAGQTSSGGITGVIGITTDGTKSGMIADTSDTAQPRAMIQLYNGVTDEALATCDSVLSDVAELKYDYVVDFQRPTADNNYTWYRKYKSGWVEQGGSGSASSASALNVTFPVEMENSNYTLSTSSSSATSTSSSTAHGCHFTRKDTTGCSIIILKGNSGDWIAGNISWQVSGMAQG